MTMQLPVALVENPPATWRSMLGGGKGAYVDADMDGRTASAAQGKYFGRRGGHPMTQPLKA
jgi:hypothetical protein